MSETQAVLILTRLLCFFRSTDPTSPPGNPDILDYDKDYVEVKFDPPEKDNGAPVQGYVIEYREKGEDEWKKVRGLGSFVR